MLLLKVVQLTVSPSLAAASLMHKVMNSSRFLCVCLCVGVYLCGVDDIVFLNVTTQIQVPKLKTHSKWLPLPPPPDRC